MDFLVKLEDSPTGTVWLADGDGDPPRTLKIENAKRFPNRRTALKALIEARKFRPFRRGHVVCADNPVSVFDTE